MAKLTDNSGTVVFEGEIEGGGSQPLWVGPYNFDAADYNPALGSGWDGILVENSLPPGMLLTRVALVMDVIFDPSSATINVYAGTLAGDDFATKNFPSDPTAYEGAIGVSGFTVTAFGSGGAVLLTGADVSQLWIDSFSNAPTTGSGRLWLELTAPTAP